MFEKMNAVMRAAKEVTIDKTDSIRKDIRNKAEVDYFYDTYMKRRDNLISLLEAYSAKIMWTVGYNRIVPQDIRLNDEIVEGMWEMEYMIRSMVYDARKATPASKTEMKDVLHSLKVAVSRVGNWCDKNEYHMVDSQIFYDRMDDYFHKGGRNIHRFLLPITMDHYSIDTETGYVNYKEVI